MDQNIVIVIPAYKVERHIKNVITSIPEWVKYVIVVDDASPDQTGKIVRDLQTQDTRLIYLRHEKNQGVGGAMITGFKKALELNADIVVKVDGDEQMDLALLPNLIHPLVSREADYAKGNRFLYLHVLDKMPIIRRIGNLIFGFLVKAATGYWNIFDPTNGFIGIRREILSILPLEKIDKGFFFETSMLANLYLYNAKVADVGMPARYGDEISNLKISRVIMDFPPKLLKIFVRRLLLKYFLYDFSMASVYLLFGFPLVVFGLVFGIIQWLRYSSLGVPAPTGTVILPTLSVLLGIQFILSAIQIDIESVPKKAISSSPNHSKNL